MSKKEQILKKILGATKKIVPDSEIYLFGSRARGDARKFSDWDLLILLNVMSLSFDTETKIMDELYEIELETGEVISPMIYTKKDWNENHTITPLFENIQKEGVKIR